MALGHLLSAGVQAFLQPTVILYTLLGVVAGLVIGAIPGFTITMGVVLVLPLTFYMSPMEGLGTMVGVFVGGATGGLISGTLLGIPGTPSSVATTFDGFPMARSGQPGRALALGNWSSAVAGLLGGVVLVVAAPALSLWATRFGPWEYFSLIFFGLTVIASLSGANLVKGLVAGLLGLLFATVGYDPISASPRFTFGFTELNSGFDFLPVLIGMFAFSQLLEDLTAGEQRLERLRVRDRRQLSYSPLLALRELWQSRVVLLWSTVVGLFIGVLPAAGGSIANILAYDQAQKISRRREVPFGQGNPDGIIASEAANNSVAAGALITMMAFGIPGDAVTAVMLGALLIQGIQPGPLFITNQPTLAGGIMVAYLVATVVTVFIFNLSLRYLVSIERVPKDVLVPAVLLLCGLGAYTLNNRVFNVWVVLLFGLLGFALKQAGFPLAAFVLGFILGPLAETNLRRALMNQYSLLPFVTRPISLGLLVLAALSVVYVAYSRLAGRGLFRQPLAVDEK